jgi:DNA-binding MarR family transcriptional regulator
VDRDLGRESLHMKSAAERLNELAEFRFRMRKFLSFSENQATAAGITAQQYQLMQVVASSGKSEHSISSLADRLLLRHNSAVELVDRAENAGLVVRVGDVNDQRKSLVRLTETGEALLLRLVEEHLTYLRTSGGEILYALQPLVDSGDSALHS